MLDDEELDLEDLEARLYSQIYHSNAQEVEVEVDPLPIEVLHQFPGDMRPPNRYFQHGLNRAGKKYSKKRFNKTNPYVPWTNNKSPSQPAISSSNYEKSNQQQQRYQVEQVVVVSPYSPADGGTTSYNKRRNRAKNKRALYKENKSREVLNSPTVSSSTIANSSTKINTHTRFSDSEEIVGQDEIITLSDSDGEDCELVPKIWPMVTVDSDEESEPTVKTDVDDNAEALAANTTADDVIFVEPAPVEVISLDEDADPVADQSGQLSDNQQVSSSETLSVSSSNNSGNSFAKYPSNESPQKLSPKTRILSTPESSVSNDFMDSSNIELRDNFNFSLHGADFDEGGEFVRPPKLFDSNETESTGSTIDMIALKTSVFSEVEFPRGEDMFSEANLESFGNLITPVRNQAGKETAEPSTSKEVANVNLNVYAASSGSSSESDFGEPVNCRPKNKAARVKNLPDLSHMPPGIKFTPVKKARKSFNLTSKFDLIEGNQSSPDGEMVKAKEKSKKRKSDTSIDKIAGKKKGQKNKKKKPQPAMAAENQEVAETSNVDTPQEVLAEDSLNDPKTVAENDIATTQETVETREQIENSSPPKEPASEIEEPPPTELTAVNKIDESIIVEVDETAEVVLENPVESIEIGSDIADKRHEGFEETAKQLKDFIVIDETFNSEFDEGPVGKFSHSDIEEIQPAKAAESVRRDVRSRLGPICPENPVNLQNASVHEIQESMSNDPNLWKVSQRDRIYVKSRQRGRRCNKCNQFGHMAIRCPNKVGPPKCSLCGNCGHLEPRCPNRICTECGRRSQFSTTYCISCFKYRKEQCNLCGMLGHIRRNCPDMWRRYHLTTDEGPLVAQAGPPLKPKDKLWCSGCAKSGHLQHTCTLYTSSYLPSNPNVVSYEDIYGSSHVETQHQQEVNFEADYEQQWQQRVANSQMIHGQRQQRNVNRHMIREPNQENFRVASRHMEEIIFRRIQEQNLMNTLNPPNYVAPASESYPPVSYLGNALMPLIGDQQFVAAQNIIQNPYQTPPNQVETAYNTRLVNNSNEFFFEDNLPNFLSFESNEPSIEAYKPKRRVQRAPLTDKERVARKMNRMTIFLSGPVGNMQEFVSSELGKLTKMAMNSRPFLKNFKKFSFPRRKPCYKELNMLLFGICLFNDGNLHLNNLKNVKGLNPKFKLTFSKRRSLYDSYCYIFGVQKHDNVDYKQLLRRV